MRSGRRPCAAERFVGAVKGGSCIRRQPSLTQEVLVEAGFGDAHLGGDVVHRHQVKTAIGEDARGSVEDGVLALLKRLVLEADAFEQAQKIPASKKSYCIVASLPISNYSIACGSRHQQFRPKPASQRAFPRHRRGRRRGGWAWALAWLQRQGHRVTLYEA